jgi:hypothetical protein
MGLIFLCQISRSDPLRSNVSAHSSSKRWRRLSIWVDAFVNTFCNNRLKRMSLFLKFCLVTQFDHMTTCASISLEAYLIVLTDVFLKTCGDSSGLDPGAF